MTPSLAQPGLPQALQGMLWRLNQAWAARSEMAVHLEDVLARRTRALFLNANAASEAAPGVAAVMARELGRGEDWVAGQVRAFRALAKRYFPA